MDPDLDAIAADLAEVEATLTRLAEAPEVPGPAGRDDGGASPTGDAGAPAPA